MALGRCQSTIVQASGERAPTWNLNRRKMWRKRWLGGYEGLEVVPGIVGTAMLGISIIEMTLSTIVRMSALYAWKGPGPWMAAALWSTAFQVVVMPYRWALEWGQNQGEAIAQTMESRVGGANLPLDGGGTSTTDQERN